MRQKHGKTHEKTFFINKKKYYFIFFFKTFFGFCISLQKTSFLAMSRRFEKKALFSRRFDKKR